MILTDENGKQYEAAYVGTDFYKLLPIQPIESRYEVEVFGHAQGHLIQVLVGLNNEQAEAVATAIKSLLEYVHTPAPKVATENTQDADLLGVAAKAWASIQKGTS